MRTAVSHWNGSKWRESWRLDGAYPCTYVMVSRANHWCGDGVTQLLQLRSIRPSYINLMLGSVGMRDDLDTITIRFFFSGTIFLKCTKTRGRKPCEYSTSTWWYDCLIRIDCYGITRGKASDRPAPILLNTLKTLQLSRPVKISTAVGTPVLPLRHIVAAFYLVVVTSYFLRPGLIAPFSWITNMSTLKKLSGAFFWSRFSDQETHPKFFRKKKTPRAMTKTK